MTRIIFFSALIIYIFLSGINSSNSIAGDDKTRVIIIGTVHQSTFNFDSDTLINIFNMINPDVILVECDSTYMTSDFRLKDHIKYLFPETMAITEYSKSKSVELRPYDINGRDIFLNDYRRKRNKRNLFSDIYTLTRNDKLNNESIDILNRVLSMMNITDKMANSTLSYMNSPEGSINIDTINYYSYAGLDRLIESTPELTDYRSYWDDEHSYWQKRNDVMIENILNHMRQFEKKTIVVLCGFSHKNILKEGLLKVGIENSVVQEFWEK